VVTQGSHKRRQRRKGGQSCEGVAGHFDANDGDGRYASSAHRLVPCRVFTPASLSFTATGLPAVLAVPPAAWASTTRLGMKGLEHGRAATALKLTAVAMGARLQHS
jgi:hypothetical protein